MVNKQKKNQLGGFAAPSLIAALITSALQNKTAKMDKTQQIQLDDFLKLINKPVQQTQNVTKLKEDLTKELTTNLNNVLFDNVLVDNLKSNYNLTVYRKYEILDTAQIGGAGCNIFKFFIKCFTFVNNNQILPTTAQQQQVTEQPNILRRMAWVDIEPEPTPEQKLQLQITLERDNNLKIIEKIITVNDFKLNCKAPHYESEFGTIDILSNKCIEFIFSELEKVGNIDKHKFALATLQALEPLPKDIVFKIIENFNQKINLDNELDISFTPANALCTQLLNNKTCINVNNKNHYTDIIALCNNLLNRKDKTNEEINALLYKLQIYTGNTDWIPLYNKEQSKTTFDNRLSNYLNTLINTSTNLDTKKFTEDFYLIKKLLITLAKLIESNVEVIFIVNDDEKYNYIINCTKEGTIFYEKKINISEDADADENNMKQTYLNEYNNLEHIIKSKNNHNILNSKNKNYEIDINDIYIYDNECIISYGDDGEEHFLYNIRNDNNITNLSINLNLFRNNYSKHLYTYIKNENNIETSKNNIMFMINNLTNINTTNMSVAEAELKSRTDNITTEIENLKTEIKKYNKSREALKFISPKSVLYTYVYTKHYLNLFYKKYLKETIEKRNKLPGTGGKLIKKHKSKERVGYKTIKKHKK